MIIVCPRCQTKLRVPDDKIKPEGSKFKCPKCPAVLNIRRPAAPEPAPNPVIEQRVPVEASPPAAAPEPAEAPSAFTPHTALVAHENETTALNAEAALKVLGFSVLRASDGVQAMISALKGRPSVVLVDPALPKISGFDLAKTMKERPELRGIKVAIISSSKDYRRARRNPSASADIDAYIDEDELMAGMGTMLRTAISIEMPPLQPSLQEPPALEESEAEKRARRLVRTVFSDIALYNPEKLVDALRTNTFAQLFEEDIREGFKHYVSRVPDDVRKRRDYFKETMDDFITTKKRALGIE